MGIFTSFREASLQRELEAQRPQIAAKRSGAATKSHEQLRLLDEMERLTHPSNELTASERRVQLQALSLAYNLAAAATIVQEAQDASPPQASQQDDREQNPIEAIADAIFSQQITFWSNDYLNDMNSIGGTALPVTDENKSTLMAGTAIWSLYQAGRDGANLEALQATAAVIGQRFEQRGLMTKHFFIQLLGYLFETAKKQADDSISLRNVSMGIARNLSGLPPLTEQNRKQITFIVIMVQKGLQIGHNACKDLLATLRW